MVGPDAVLVTGSWTGPGAVVTGAGAGVAGDGAGAAAAAGVSDVAPGDGERFSPLAR